MLAGTFRGLTLFALCNPFHCLGASVQKLKGRTGRDLIVGRQFWVALPGLAWDGLCYSLRFTSTRTKSYVLRKYQPYDSL